jgi:hypothetical protein
MEDSPCESIKNNVIGTYKTAYAAAINGCKKFVLISTDKAVNPTNIMGASKRMCEMIIQSFDRKIRFNKFEDLSADAAPPEGRQYAKPLEIQGFLVNVKIHGRMFGHIEGRDKIVLLVVNQVYFLGKRFLADDIFVERRGPVKLVVADKHFFSAHLQDLLDIVDIGFAALADAPEFQLLRSPLDIVSVQDLLHRIRYIICLLVSQEGVQRQRDLIAVLVV